MPLDRANGEVIEGLEASLHIVIPHRYLAAMTNVQVEFERPGKFRPVKGQRQIFTDAAAIAAEAFQKAGAILPTTLMPGALRTASLSGVAALSTIGLDESGVLVQVYPFDAKIAVVFCRKIGRPDGAPEDHYVTRQYDVPREVIEALLNAAGKKMPRLN